jgi:subfamily B ATP-binding cassette protein MsbA
VESEKALLEGLERMRGRFTMLVIAHRLSTVRHADRIYVVSEGKVVESGPHESLLQRGGLYAAMRRTSEIGLAR